MTKKENIMKMSVVIPTKDRPLDLDQCINSILSQTFPPEEIIIIDDGELSENFIEKIKNKIKKKEIICKYIRKKIPGLSTSRNLGASKSKNPIVLFLDDDIILDKDYIEILRKNWERYYDEDKLGGMGGLIKNLRMISPLERFYYKLFSLSSPIKWDVTNVGFQVWDPSIREKEKVYYLPGGIASFKKSLIEKLPFKQLSPGRTPSDDVEFFLRAKKAGYYFYLDPRATLFHKISFVARENEFTKGEKEGFNQCIIFRDNVEKNLKNYLKFIWSSIGWILRQFLAGHIRKAMGLVAGYIKVEILGIKKISRFR